MTATRSLDRRPDVPILSGSARAAAELALAPINNRASKPTAISAAKGRYLSQYPGTR